MTSPGPPEREWEAGWGGHSDAQTRRLAALSLAEKLAWLEDAHRLVKQMQNTQRKTRAPDAPDPSQ